MTSLFWRFVSPSVCLCCSWSRGLDDLAQSSQPPKKKAEGQNRLMESEKSTFGGSYEP